MTYPSIGGGGEAFPLGIEQNTFDAGTGDKAAAELLRDNYATANPDWLTYYDNNQDRTIELLYIDNGDAVAVRQSYINSAWVDQRSTFGARGLPGSGTDFSAVSENHIPAIGPGPDKIPYDSGARVLDDGTLLAPRRFAVESGSIDVGPLVVISEQGGFIGVTNNVTGATFTLVDFLSLRTQASPRPRILALTEAENSLVIQPVDADTITANPLTFNYTTALTARTNAIMFRAASSMSNVRIRIADTVSGVDFKFLPDRASWLDGTGYSFNAGDNQIDLGDTPLPLEPNRELTVEIRADSVSLLGTSTGNVPYLESLLQRGEFRDLPYMSDITTQVPHPVTLRRDMPSTEDAQALIDASLNGNSALWEVANDQIPASNRSDATLVAQRAGMLDLDGNEIPTTPVAANTIQMRSGTTVRVFAANDYRVVNSPVFEGDIPSEISVQDEGAQITATTSTINFVGDGVTVTNVGGVATVTITGGGGTPPTPVTTDLRYGLSSASDPALVDFASLTDVASPTDPQTVSTGTTTAGQYYHIYTSNTHEIARITDTVLQQDVYVRGGTGNIFTLTEDSRTEGSVTYDALTIGPLNAGVDEEYIVRFS